ncbi:MAG TPA: hypothetical protein VI318_26255 [Baekduia sp.]
MVDALTFLEGEQVFLRVDGMGAASRVGAIGELKREPLPPPLPCAWRVGAAVVVTLAQSDYRSAHLRTIDGTCHFRLTMEFGGVTLFLGDPGLLATDYEGA